MEKIGDFGMMSDPGNKKIARAVSQIAKNEKDLKSKLMKISTMQKGKYADVEEDEVYQALDAFQWKTVKKVFKTDPICNINATS